MGIPSNSDPRPDTPAGKWAEASRRACGTAGRVPLGAAGRFLLALLTGLVFVPTSAAEVHHPPAETTPPLCPLARGAATDPSRPYHSGVELYYSPRCPYSRQMEQFLIDQGIPYTKYDVLQNKHAAALLKAVGARGVPVLRIGARFIHGYLPDQVLSSLSE
jgi:glutaredoxin